MPHAALRSEATAGTLGAGPGARTQTRLSTGSVPLSRLSHGSAGAPPLVARPFLSGPSRAVGAAAWAGR